MKWNRQCIVILVTMLCPPGVTLSYSQSGADYKQALITSTEPIANFRDAITRAVLVSPRVNADWYNFEANREAERAARGDYFPRVDVISEWGREERSTPVQSFDDYSRDASRFSITQMLFDGFATRDEVARLGYSKLSRYYEFKRSSEEIALEASRAYLDTLKFQQLVTYARENYLFHRQIYDLVAERTNAGISQGVDLDQAAARIALAESNLVTEVTNLHDVQTAFQRIVGVMPAQDLQLPKVPSSMVPELQNDALAMAYLRSPEIDAAIENLRSTQEAMNASNAPMMPRLDLRYRNEIEHDTDGFQGRYDEEALEVVISYNLYRGGADSARKREFYNLYNAAIEQRKQACLNVRQQVIIAFNDAKALEQQIILHSRNLIAQDKTRRAYRDQFDLGQRTLLDMLDSQNEYFDVQRAYANSQADLLIAQARILANMGILLAAMDVDGLNAEKIAELDLNLARDNSDKNSQHLCPLGPPGRTDLDINAILARTSGSEIKSTTGAMAVAALAANNGRYKDAGSGRVTLELNVFFEFNSSIIAKTYDEEIAKAARVLRDHPDVVAVVEGHTCNIGAPDYNQWLSQRRADAVREMMIKNHNIDPSQITAVGFGQSQPIATNDTAQGRERNRRVELVVDSNDQ